MPACPPNWDTLSGWQHPRKPCPKLSAQNGMYFPDGMPSGNRVPESRPRTGQTFRLKRPAETASRNRRSNWDAVSGFLLFRKARPILEPKSGTQFPVCGGAPNKRPRLAIKSRPKAQHIQLMLSANSPSAMVVRTPPYPRLRTRLYGVSTMGRSGRSLPSNAR